MLATLRKCASLTLPTSIRRVAPAAMTSAAATGSAGMPRVSARSLAVPKGRMPTGFPPRSVRGSRRSRCRRRRRRRSHRRRRRNPDQPRQRVAVGALADVEVEAVAGEAGDGAAERRLGARRVEIDDDEKPSRLTGGSGEAAVAVLVLLARAAGAGLVAADLAPGRGIVRVDLRRAARRPFRAGCEQAAARGLGVVDLVLAGERIDVGRLAASPTSSSGTSGGGRWTISTRISWPVTASRRRAEHRLEELEGLGLVLVQRVALGVAAEADHLAQMVERDQMLAPEMVERLQQHRLLDLAHDLGAEARRRAARRPRRRRA